MLCLMVIACELLIFADYLAGLLCLACAYTFLRFAKIALSKLYQVTNSCTHSLACCKLIKGWLGYLG